MFNGCGDVTPPYKGEKGGFVNFLLLPLLRGGPLHNRHGAAV
jgi:hypothetical protein